MNRGEVSEFTLKKSFSISVVEHWNPSKDFFLSGHSALELFHMSDSQLKL